MLRMISLLGCLLILTISLGVPSARESVTVLASLKPMVNVEGNAQYPSFSPDNRYIAFEAGIGGKRHIWVAKADGTKTRQLTFGKRGEYRPVWSPDGKKIAFFSDNGGDFDIWVMDVKNPDKIGADGKNLRQIKLPGDQRYPTWSPDGKRIAFSDFSLGKPYIFVMNADGSEVSQITGDDTEDRRDYEPAWSPVNDKIAFFSSRDVEGGDYDVWIINADGTGLTRLTSDAADDFFYSWTPDGSRILFCSNRNGNSDIWIMDADGSDQSPLLDFDVELWHPVLSKDSVYLFFEAPVSLQPEEKNLEPIGIFRVPLKLLRPEHYWKFDEGRGFLLSSRLKSELPLRIEWVRGQQETERGYVKIRLNSFVDVEVAKEYVTVEPEVNYRIVSNYRYLELRGEFKAGNGYTVAIKKGLWSQNGAVLKRDFSMRVVMPNMEPNINFVGEGIYLSREGKLNVGLATINVDKVQIEIERVFANNLVYLISSGSMGSHSDIDNLGKSIYRGDLIIDSKRNEEVITPINLKAYLTDERIGVFRITAYQSDRR